ncbi:hypothetical protein Goarm_010484, partial [Gossypium armourianum]|nr:hypothetical protein [Gossypium armourianum]
SFNGISYRFILVQCYFSSCSPSRIHTTKAFFTSSSHPNQVNHRYQSPTYNKLFVLVSTFCRTATTFMNFLLRHLKDSESTCPLLLTTPSFKKSWDADLELQTGYMVVDDIVKSCIYIQ